MGELRAGGAPVHGPEINQTEGAVVTSASPGQEKSGTGARSRRLGLDEVGGVFSGRSRGSRGHRRGDGESDGAAVDGPKPNRSKCVVFSQAILEPDEVGSGRGHQRDRGPTRLEARSLEITGLIGAKTAGRCTSSLLE